MTESRQSSQSAQDSDINALIQAAKTDKQAYAKLVEELSERVWALWREELRLNQERRGGSARR